MCCEFNEISSIQYEDIEHMLNVLYLTLQKDIISKRKCYYFNGRPLWTSTKKKSAGQSHRYPLHGHIFFKNELSVDEHVAGASERRMYDKVH